MSWCLACGAGQSAWRATICIFEVADRVGVRGVRRHVRGSCRRSARIRYCVEAFGDGGGGDAGVGAFGSDAFLDDLYLACEAGDFVACDDLYFEAAVGSAYQFFGDTCGGLQAAETGRSCEDVFGGGGAGAGAFGTFGSDAFLDDLYLACDAGDLVACDDLFFEAPSGSEYETYGDTCGGRQAARTGALCANLV